MADDHRFLTAQATGYDTIQGESLVGHFEFTDSVLCMVEMKVMVTQCVEGENVKKHHDPLGGSLSHYPLSLR